MEPFEKEDISKNRSLCILYIRVKYAEPKKYETKKYLHIHTNKAKVQEQILVYINSESQLN